MRHLVVIALAVLGLQQGVSSAVERMRAAWGRQDARAVVADADRVVIQLPHEAATAPLDVEQAARALARTFRDASEISLDVHTVRALSTESVYAELRRRFRVRGSDAVAEQRVFAAYRLRQGKWVLTELRVGAAGQ